MSEKKRKIAIIGGGHIGMEGFYDAVKLKDCHKSEIIMIETKKDIYTIEVNGVKYERIEHEKPKSSKFGALIAMASALAPSAGFVGIDYIRKRPHVDIIAEYGLIELKQSKLSRSDRDWVKWQFNMNYKKVK